MNIANIINFVRAVEPREEDDSYLPVTLREELELCNKYGFVNTVLLQYDALIRDEYTEIIREYGYGSEIGLWLEVVEPLVKDCGMQWRGRWPWDWRNDVGFLIGYEPKEREAIIDMAFRRFKEIFGCYPQSVGSWHIDAHSLEYMYRRYGIRAACNCKDQYGTDCYTIWGGYYSGAYYPAATNMLCPANTRENQIDVPVFRMLGSDPIHQYDLGLGELGKGQSVMSLEPVYGNSGADEGWVRWFLKENYNGKNISLAYAQFGQENSFGIAKIKDGLEMQFRLLAEMVEKGETELLTLADSGKRFSEVWDVTPPSALCIDSDCLETDYKTVWYMSKAYRANLLYDHGHLRFRDIFIFDERFREHYLDKPTVNNECFFSNVPLIDGFRFSSKEKTAGVYFTENGADAAFSGDYETFADESSACLKIGNELSVQLNPESILISSTRKISLHFVYESFKGMEYRITDKNTLTVLYFGFERSIRLGKGVLEAAKDGFDISSQDGKIEILFSRF